MNGCRSSRTTSRYPLLYNECVKLGHCNSFRMHLMWLLRSSYWTIATDSVVLPIVQSYSAVLHSAYSVCAPGWLTSCCYLFCLCFLLIELVLSIGCDGKADHGFAIVLGWYYTAMAVEVKVQARKMEKSICETERQVHPKLFLQEKDYWDESGMHQEYILGEMPHSAEYVGVKERQCQSIHHAWWGWFPSKSRMAPGAWWNTAFEQLGSAFNWELILHLLECYQGHTSIGQSRLQPDTEKHVKAEIKEDLKGQIRLHRASWAPTRDQSEVLFTIWSLARSLQRTEGATVQSPGQSQNQRQRLTNRTQ